jgi:hypothetical protein
MSDFLERFRRLELTVFISCLLAMMISCAVWTAVRTDTISSLLVVSSGRPCVAPGLLVLPDIKRSCLLFLEESRKFRERPASSGKPRRNLRKSFVGPSDKTGESVADGRRGLKEPDLRSRKFPSAV